jgi:hypothetical protein
VTRRLALKSLVLTVLFWSSMGRVVHGNGGLSHCKTSLSLVRVTTEVFLSHFNRLHVSQEYLRKIKKKLAA